MKRIWGILLCILLVAGCHTSKRSVLYRLSDGNEVVDWMSLRSEYPRAEGVYLYFERTIAHDLKPDFKNNAPRWYFFESYHWKEAVLRDRPAEDETAFAVALASNEKLRDVAIRIVYENGLERLLDRGDLEREGVGGDSTRYWLAGAPLEEGATVEVVYEVERSDLYDRPPLSHDVPFQMDRPVLSYAFDFTYPRDWDIQVKRMGRHQSIELSESHQEREETISLHYSAEDVPAFTRRDYRPYYKEVAPYFHVQMQAFEVGNVLSYQAPSQWDLIAEEFQSFAADYARRVRGKARDEWESLGAEGGTDQERIAAVLSHVRETLELSRHRDLGEVVKQDRGDAYAITGYTKALLEEAGFSPVYMISHSAEGGYFDDEFISSEQLYMPLLKVENAGHPLYVFPALDGVPSGYIPPAYERQPALVYNAGRFENLITLPGARDDAYVDRGNYHVYIDYDGAVRVEATIELGQYSAYLFNQRRHAGDIGTLTRSLLPHDSSQVSDFVYRIDEAGFHAPMKLRADYSLHGCFDELGDDYMLRSCGLFEPTTTAWHPFDPHRDGAIQLPASVSHEQEVTVTYPAEWTLVSDVFDVEETFKKGQIRRQVSSEPGSLKIAQRLMLYEQLMYPMTVSAAIASFDLPDTALMPYIELSKSVWADLASLGEIEKGGPWTLVVGSYTTYEEAQQNAEAYSRKVMGKGYRISVMVDNEKLTTYRVVVGTFATRTSVETALHILGEDVPYDTWMLGLKKPLTATTGEPGPIKH